jgi:hypothetical protein
MARFTKNVSKLEDVFLLLLFSMRLNDLFQANTVKLWSWSTSELDPSQENLAGDGQKGAEPELLATFDHTFGDVNEIKVLAKSKLILLRVNNTKLVLN